MGWESFGVVRFDLGPLLQGQTRIAKLKSAYNLLIIGRFGMVKPRKSWAENLLVWSDLTLGSSFKVVGFDLGPLLQGQTRIGKLKSAYNSLIISPRGLGW